jgi:hypothetical protein
MNGVNIFIECTKLIVIPSGARNLVSSTEAINKTTARNSARLLFVAGGGDF